MLDVKFDPLPTILARCLEDMAADLKGKANTAGLRGAGKPLVKAMRAAVRSDSGALRRSMGARVLSRASAMKIGVSPDQKAVLVGPVKKVADPGYGGSPGKVIHQGFKAHWLEFGTRPHVIDIDEINKRPRRRRFVYQRKVMKFNGVYRRRVSHPGTRATHFMARANAATGQAQAEGFYLGMARYLDRKKQC